MSPPDCPFSSISVKQKQHLGCLAQSTLKRASLRRQDWFKRGYIFVGGDSEHQL